MATTESRLAVPGLLWLNRDDLACVAKRAFSLLTGHFTISVLGPSRLYRFSVWTSVLAACLFNVAF